jgi:hypothetical protein
VTCRRNLTLQFETNAEEPYEESMNVGGKMR